MATVHDPTSQQDFPTSAKPVFIRLGLLIAGLVAILVYLYLDSQSASRENLPEQLKHDVEDLVGQKGIPLQPGSSPLEGN